MFDEPQDLPADLGGVAKDHSVSAGIIGAVGEERGLGLALYLAVQRVDVLAARPAEGAPQQEGDQEGGDDRQAEVCLDNPDAAHKALTEMAAPQPRSRAAPSAASTCSSPSPAASGPSPDFVPEICAATSRGPAAPAPHTSSSAWVPTT